MFSRSAFTFFFRFLRHVAREKANETIENKSFCSISTFYQPPTKVHQQIQEEKMWSKVHLGDIFNVTSEDRARKNIISRMLSSRIGCHLWPWLEQRLTLA